MAIDFSHVKSWTIPEGEVKKAAKNGVVIWEKPSALPVKGDVITFAAGTGYDNFKVLKVNGTVAEVLHKYQKYQSTFSQASAYLNSNVQQYCNNTFYNSLSTAVKNAIVDKTFDVYNFASSGTPIETYTGVNKNGSSYTAKRISKAETITQHAYCLTFDDIFDYLGTTSSMTASNTTLTANNLQELFGVTQTGRVINCATQWALSSSTYYIWGYSYEYGTIDRLNGSYAMVAFQIDLSQISWQKV